MTGYVGIMVSGNEVSGSNPMPVTLSVPETVNAQTGTTYTVLNTDGGKLVTFTNAAAIAVTLPQANAATFIAGWWIDVVNLGVGKVTITPTTSTINGAATLTLLTGMGARIVSDGTNYLFNPGFTALTLPRATVAATGTVLADAAQLAYGFTTVTAADGTKGVKLVATPTAGARIRIKNNAAAILKVYPDASATINAIAANAAISMAANTIAEFIADSATQWYTLPLLPS